MWGRIDPARLGEVLHYKRCQVCGEALDETLVLMIRPSDFLRGVAVEPGLHPECSWYSRRACVMLAGVVHRYNPAGSTPLTRCSDPLCRCRFWTPEEDAFPGRAGKPAEAWYEAWIRREDYHVFTAAADESGPAATGIALRHVPFLRLRKVRDPAPDSGDTQPMDLLAAIIASRRLWRDAGLDNNDLDPRPLMPGANHRRRHRDPGPPPGADHRSRYPHVADIPVDNHDN
ncbi:hypothetical protein [Nocardia asteroides]|uniref:hypothetical protein n=1 Tax=Nocardia asteroides TaxID=1824 RepID=UPI00342D5CC5